MAQYIEALDLDNADGDSILVAAWDEGGSIEVVIISKETTTFPHDDGNGNLGDAVKQTGTSGIYLNLQEACALIGALQLAVGA